MVGEIETLDVAHSQSTDSGHSAAVIDLNDPALTSENLNENPEGDSYATPPPLPDGKWRAKLTQLDIKDSKGQPQRYAAFQFPKMNDGKPFLATNVQSTILDASGKHDGFKLTDYWVKTALDRSGNSGVGTILTKLKQTLTPASDASRMEQFLRVLASEPELVVETAWEASCQTCQEAAKKRGDKSPKPFLLGMHRFPQTRTGHDPVVTCPTCKGSVRAQARIAQYHSLDTPHNK